MAFDAALGGDIGTMTRLSTFTPRMWLILAHDLLATAAAVIASFFIRFEEAGLAQRWRLLVILLPGFLVYSGLVYVFSGLYKAKWRFTSLPDLYNIVRAATVLAVTLLALDYVLLAPNFYGTFFFGKITIVLYWMLQIAFLSGPRITYRYFRYTRTLQRAKEADSTPILVVGRTADADVLLRAIESGAVTKIRPVGILSPSLSDRGQAIRGISVLGDPDDIESVVADLGGRGTNVKRLVLTPSALAPEAKPETILMRARRLGLVTSRLPALDEGGEALRLAPVNVEDLLLRPRVRIDYGRLEGFVRGKSIIVTGGGGSIGAEICDRIVTFGVSRLLVIENSEPALHAVLEMLATKSSPAKIEGRLADVRDRARIFRLMNDFRPDIVFHAAALKHVPLLERDWGEGVKTNVFGSVNVADAAVAAGASAMVVISTDKAIEPVSVLGAGPDQALCRDVLPGARQRFGAPERWAEAGHAVDCGALRQRTRLQRFRGAEIQGADRGRRSAHGHAPRHGALLHDHSGGVRPRRHCRKPRPGAGACGRRGLCPQYGAAGEDRGSRRADDPAVRARARPGHRYHLHRHPAGRAVARDFVCA
jgi:O-antigen biosynthesis protein WbqV